MNKGGEQNIIVDSWLGFADSKEGAISRYKKIKDDSTINKAIQLIATEIYSEYSVPIEEILEDFDVQGKFVLKKNDFIKEKDKNNIGNYIQEKYPKLVL